jgi:hypothetical protein
LPPSTRRNLRENHLERKITKGAEAILKGKNLSLKNAAKKIFCFNDDELVRKNSSSLSFLHSVKINPIMCALFYFIFYKREEIFLFVAGAYTKRTAVGNEPQHSLWRQRAKKKSF